MTQSVFSFPNLADLCVNFPKMMGPQPQTQRDRKITVHNVAFHQGLYSLRRLNQSLGTEICHDL